MARHQFARGRAKRVKVRLHRLAAALHEIGEWFSVDLHMHHVTLRRDFHLRPRRGGWKTEQGGAEKDEGEPTFHRRIFKAPWSEVKGIPPPVASSANGRCAYELPFSSFSCAEICARL